jgi:hypothetical protein
VGKSGGADFDAPISLKLTTGEDVTKGLLLFAGTLAKGQRFSDEDVKKIQVAVKEIAGSLESEAGVKEYNVYFTPNGSTLTIGFSDAGKVLSGANGAFAKAKKFMDKFDIGTSSAGGNRIEIVKNSK